MQSILIVDVITQYNPTEFSTKLKSDIITKPMSKTNDSTESSKLFQYLNPQQIKAVKHLNGPALVVAGPGSGKTRVLTHRVANLIKEHGIHESNILCVTFTNKAAGEIKERVNKLLGQLQSGRESYEESQPASRSSEIIYKLTWSGTFHSICSRILRKDGFNIGIPPSFVIYDTDDQISLIKSIEKDFGIDTKKVNAYAVLETISGAKSELLEPEEYEKFAFGYFQKTAAKIYPEYQKRLRLNHALDFDDLIKETVKLFKQDPAVLEKYQNYFKYILVDEYQDTNKSQYMLTKILAEKQGNLFVVGDMSQAIYSFRGADYRNILNFQMDYPDAAVYNLEQNYRSTQTILDAAKNIIKNNSTHIPLDLWTQNKEGEKIVTYTGSSDFEEAEFVVGEILNALASGKDYIDLAVLYRTNAQSRNIEEHLIKANVPYRIVGGLKFYARKEIKDAVAFLRVVHNPKDSVSWERIINIPPRGIGQKSVDALKKGGWNLEELQEKSKIPFKVWAENKEKYSTLELLDDILLTTGYIKWLDDGTEENKNRIENIKELRTVAAKFLNLEELLENVALIESFDKPSNDNRNTVTLMTVHSSKGLEFPVVFIIGMEEGLFPHSQSLMELSELEEERRLCYVAVTRAMERVYITLARTRMYFGSLQSNIPSRFLGEIPQNLILNLGLYGIKENGHNDNENTDFNKDRQSERGTYGRSVESFLDDLDFNRKNFKW